MPYRLKPSRNPACPAARLVVALVVAGVAAPTTSFANPVGRLASHQAVYDMRLDKAGTSSGITELVGRMVFEFRGNSCEGYTQSMRLVTKVTDSNGGGSVSDMRTTSWEEGTGQSFRFNSTTLRDARVQETVSGKAEQRKKGDLQVQLRKPARSTLSLDADVMFPVQHTRELLAAAQAGRQLVQANVYDGSEQGRKFFATTSFVGKPITPAAADTEASEIKEQGLSQLKSWPVSISYYEAEAKQDEGLPSYQMAFRFFENGVTRNLKIDYGSFAIDGRLAKVTYFKEQPCD